MNKSEKSYVSNDNTYNFNYELDISNTKKEKTGEMFFNFDDFQNVGDDKTIKSSHHKTFINKNNNYSSILKPEFD